MFVFLVRFSLSSAIGSAIELQSTFSCNLHLCLCLHPIVAYGHDNLGTYRGFIDR